MPVHAEPARGLPTPRAGLSFAPRMRLSHALRMPVWQINDSCLVTNCVAHCARTITATQGKHRQRRPRTTSTSVNGHKDARASLLPAMDPPCLGLLSLCHWKVRLTYGMAVLSSLSRHCCHIDCTRAAYSAVALIPDSLSYHREWRESRT